MEKFRKRQSERGWTLIELIIVIIILGLIAGVAIPAYLDLTKSAEINTCQAQQAAIKSAVLLYYAKHQDMPKDLTADMFVNNTIPTCPTGGTLTYKRISEDRFSITCSHEEHNTPATSP